MSSGREVALRSEVDGDASCLLRCTGNPRRCASFAARLFFLALCFLGTCNDCQYISLVIGVFYGGIRYVARKVLPGTIAVNLRISPFSE